MMGNNHQLNSKGPCKEGPSVANDDVRYEPKEGGEGGEGGGGERQGHPEEEESKINEVAEDKNDVRASDATLPGQPFVQRQQQQTPPSALLVHWERFLPVGTLNVLLVENDDSTRQLVSALLRNCSYEVIAAADGLQAWKILEDTSNRIDLVLTEVTMPLLSGVGLLCKIMSHRACKNIPVIMMSSNDSMGTVFKCLSKGAVDFLVKPIRKNELKNLWQHVWRRCHSSSGSGSESGIQNQKTAKSKSADDSNNNTGSNDEDDNGSFSMNLRDGSDNGSGTQSSWTRRAVEDDSPQPMSSSDQLADPHVSTCAIVIHPLVDAFCNEWVPKSANEYQEQKELSDNHFIGKDLEIGVLGNPDKGHVSYAAEKISTELMGPSLDKLPTCIQKPGINESVPGVESSNASCGPISQVADQIDGVTTDSEAQILSRTTKTPDGFSKISKTKGKTVEDDKESPSMVVSLKRLRSSGDSDDDNVLRHSDLSAFSRYNNCAASTCAPRGYGGSCSNLHDSSEAVKTESTYNVLNAIPLSHNNDMGSTTKDAITKPVACKEKRASSSTVNGIHTLALHPVPTCPSSAQTVVQEKADDGAAAAMATQPRGMQHQVQVQHHHHYYHYHHHHVHGMQHQQQPPSDNDDMSLSNMAASAPQCGSSNMFCKPMEGNTANHSVNGSVTGSNHGSNGQNGSSTAANAGGMKMENDTGVVANNEAGGSASGVEQNRLSQREAVLNKFRQKRKERNFGKKVRYQSRKKLAEQRPRVQGQFVCRTAQKHDSQEAGS